MHMADGLKEILIVPPSKQFMDGKLFDADYRRRGFELSVLYSYLRDQFGKSGYEMKTIDQSKNLEQAYAILFFETRTDSDLYYKRCVEAKLQEKMYLIMYEPYVVHPSNYNKAKHKNFKRILTFDERLVDDKIYFKYFLTIPIKKGQKIVIPRYPFGQKKLLCLISSNKYSPHPKELYSERMNAIRFMEKKHPSEFGLYGVGWDLPIIYNKIAHRLRINTIMVRFYDKIPKFLRFRQYPSYVGSIEFKRDVFPKYKFTIVYENELDIPGYISEKILDAFLYGCVPVYLGDSKIARYIPKNCFIDKRQYPTYDELYERLSRMSKEEHREYLDNIEKFLNSWAVHPFTMDSLVNSFKRVLDVK